MSEGEFDQNSVREMSDEDIKRAFEDLVEAWEDRLEAYQLSEKFGREYRPPEPPSTHLGSVENLIAYDREKWRYEERLEEVQAGFEESEAHFEGRADVVRLLLPEGHSLNHTYRGNRPELEERAYTLRHERRTPRQRRTGPGGVVSVQRTKGGTAPPL